MKKSENKGKEPLYFLGMIVFLAVYLLSLNSFDLKQLIHITDGEEPYYLEQMPKILSGETSEIGWPFFRIGTPALALFSMNVIGMPAYEFLISLNFLLYLLVSCFLFFVSIPKLFSKLKITKTPLLTALFSLIVLTNPVIVKYTFSIHPDSILFFIMIFMCYVMLSVKKHKLTILVLLSLASLIFKEAILLLVPFFIVYCIDEYGWNKKGISYAILSSVIISLIYALLYLWMKSQYAQFILDEQAVASSPILFRLQYAFSNLMKQNGLFFTVLFLYKIQLVFGLLWIPIAMQFKKSLSRLNLKNKLKNAFYLFFPLVYFLAISLSGAVGEKYVLYFSMMPYFYMLLMKSNINNKKIIEKKWLIPIIVVNILNTVLYFILITGYYKI